MRPSPMKRLFPAAFLVSTLFLGTTAWAGSDQASIAYQHALKKSSAQSADPLHDMSSMGRLANTIRQARQNQPNGAAGSRFRIDANGSVIGGAATTSLSGSPGKPDPCSPLNGDCGDGFSEGPGATQSELAVAVDATGQHIVVGFNDFRGFALAVTSVSGFAYSDDGGATFTDGGQLPAPATPVFGDPDVKYVPGGNGCQFIYSSIFLNAAFQQTMSVHRSTDCGHSWAGPFEVTAATIANDAADKEFLGVDPDTGRVGLSWTNFASNVEIRFTYSDNIMSATPPTWSAGIVLNPGSGGTGSMPRFAGNGSNNVYVAWSRQTTFYTADVQVAVSNDNGLTFGPPITLDQSPLLVPTFFIDYILGNDRVHEFPSVAVDNSSGPNRGDVYVVYATNADLDGADVVVHRSTDGGLTWTGPTVLSSRPGADRAQWFPSMAIDRDTGRVNVVYDDQGVATSGDLMEMTWVHSDDGGATWSKPSPVSTRPFHAGYGNDTSQPNLGDYNASVAQDGTLFTAFAAVPNHALFTDGEPSRNSFPYPSFLGNTVAGGTAPAAGFVKIEEPVASLHLAQVTFKESGGNGIVDAGDVVALKFPLTNYVTNPATSPGTYSNVFAELSTSTPGVTVFLPWSLYPSIPAGGTAKNFFDFLVYVSPSFVPGTPIEFALKVKTQQGSTKLLFSQATGTPVATTLLAENFDGVAPGNLPPGWVAAHGGGANTVPWTTSSTFCGTSNAAFHPDAIDNGAGDPTRWERLFSPIFAVPSNSQYVTLDMDVCYDTEDDPLQHILAYDGFMVRLTDLTSGHMVRSVFAEAFEESFTTGTFDFYPKHLPRNGNTRYFQDISAWAGSSGGSHFDSGLGLFLHNPPVAQHVHMKLPGMDAVSAQLRFEYTQDSNGTCLDVGGGPICGVQVDNVVVQSVVTKSDELAFLVLRRKSRNTWLGTVFSQPIAGTGGIAVSLSSSVPAKTAIVPSNVVIPAGSQQSPSFTVTLDTSIGGASVTITATGPSNARSQRIDRN